VLQALLYAADGMALKDRVRITWKIGEETESAPILADVDYHPLRRVSEKSETNAKRK
jgi:hypothetical protein